MYIRLMPNNNKNRQLLSSSLLHQPTYYNIQKKSGILNPLLPILISSYSSPLGCIRERLKSLDGVAERVHARDAGHTGMTSSTSACPLPRPLDSVMWVSAPAAGP